MPNHSPPLALPDQAPPLPRARIRFSLPLDSRHSTVGLDRPQQQDIVPLPLPWLPMRQTAPGPSIRTDKLPCRCSSSTGSGGREFASSSSHSSLPRSQYKDLHMSASSIPPHAAQLSLLLLSLLSLPSFVPCRGTIALLECVCAALAGSTSGPLGDQLKTPSASSLGVAIRSLFCASRIHHRSRLRDL